MQTHSRVSASSNALELLHQAAQRNLVLLRDGLRCSQCLAMVFQASRGGFQASAVGREDCSGVST